MTINICGIPHQVIECDDNFGQEIHLGEIDYAKCEIRLRRDMSPALRRETLCHEILHGILTHLGYDEYSANEQFVQCVAQAIAQTFEIPQQEDVCQ